MSTATFNSQTVGSLSFKNIMATETDVGTQNDLFIGASGYLGTFGSGTVGTQGQLQWQGVSAGAVGAGSSLTLDISYDVTNSDPTTAITRLGQTFTVDTNFPGGTPDTSLIVTESVYDLAGELVGRVTTNITNPSAPPYVVTGNIPINAGYEQLHVVLQLVASVGATAPSGSAITFSVLDEGFATSPIVGNLGSISGVAFLDANADGSEQPGEGGVAGLTATLINTATNATVQTTTTGVGGAYIFSNLFAGSYQVVLTKPNGDTFSPVGTSATLPNSVVNPAGQTGTITLASGQNVTNENAGFYAPGTFNTHVYNDANGDSTQQPGEANLPGVTVTLLTGAGTPTGQTAVTDTNGNVSFTGLTPGSYEVVVTTPAGDTVTQHTNIGVPAPVVSGTTTTAIEGLTLPVAVGSLSGHVFLDQNADGVQQAGDNNLPGVTVQLLNSAGTPIAGKTAMTDGNGFYQFTGLAAGTYAVLVTSPTGDKFSQTGADINPVIDSVVDTTGRTAPVAVVAGADTPNQNAGVYAPATITTHVYGDTNKDNLQDNGETGLGGVFVSLLSGSGTPTGQTAITDVNGNVSFTGLTPGAYQIAVTTPPGETVTQSTNIGVPIPVTSGGTGTAIEGLFAPGSISGHVFLDQNADGVQQTPETNIQGLTVQLLDSTGTPIAGQITTTDANGFYNFTNLGAGTYAVKVTGPAGDKFSPVGNSPNAALDSIVGPTGQTGPIVLAAGQSVLNQNAGVFAPASFTTHVYNDVNGDSVQAAGEPNLGGVTVTLESPQGTPIGAPGVTDVNGNVTFSNLTPGTYDVVVTTPTGDTVTQKVNVNTPIPLASGGTANAIEGLTLPPTVGALSGHVFLDQNANGVQDTGDTNLGGLTVQLLDSTGTPIAGKTTTTDTNGAYIFNNLAPGSYAVKVTGPAGDKFSPVGTNADATKDSIVNGTGQTAPVAVVAGQTTPNQNAGVFAPASFTTHVYNDVNGDSVQETGEPNLAGVTVTLESPQGTPIGVPGVTDTSGNVTFSNLTPGTYDVVVTTPTGDTVTQKTNVATPTTLVSGATANAIEGLTLPVVPGSLAGKVFLDQNANGIQENGDLNVPNATVTLLNGDGSPTGKTTLTDATGAYSFSGLTPGSYKVQVTPPTGDKFSPVGNNPNPAVDSIVNSVGLTAPVQVGAGQHVLNQNAGVYAPASFTTHVYSDVNGDSLQETGEPNLAGVTVTLESPQGTPIGTPGVTDSNGNVTFSNLTPGTYDVVVTTPTGDTVTQATNVNTPTALTSGQTGNAIEGLKIPAPAPALTIVKTVASVNGGTANGPITFAGEVIQYSVLVTNTGNVGLTNVSVNDPLTGGSLSTGVSLGVGQSETLTTSYTVKQSDIDNSNPAVPSVTGTPVYVSNMAYANGYQTITFTGSSSWSGGTVNAGQQTLTVNKGTTDIPSAHFTVYGWCVDVFHSIKVGANNISYTLQNLSANDAADIQKLAAYGNAQLASGPNALISAGVQAEIWIKEYGVTLAANTNTALVNEVAYLNNTVLPTLTVGVPGEQLVNPNCQSLYVPTGLNGAPPGITTVTNVATATSNQTGPGSSTVTTPISYAPNLAISKTVTSVGGVAGSGPATYVGEVIQYAVVVKNTGDVTLTGVSVVDPLTGGPLSSGVTLAPGQTETLTTSYKVQASDFGGFGNGNGTQVYVSNMSYANGYEVVSFKGSSSWYGGTVNTGQQKLTINNGASYSQSGQYSQYGWCVDVFHSINVGPNNIAYTLQNLAVNDASDVAKLAAYGNAQLASGPNALLSAAVQAEIWIKEYGVSLASGTDTALVNEVAYLNNTVLPTLTASGGEELYCSSAQTLYVPVAPPGPIVNTATASSDETTPQSATVSTTVSVPVPPPPPPPPPSSISILKTPSQTAVQIGGNNNYVCYTYAVTNTGPTTLNNVTITDVANGVSTKVFTDPSPLAAGATYTYTYNAPYYAPPIVTTGAAPSIGSGSGFSLGDAASYAIIAFNPASFQGTSNSPIYGDVGVGGSMPFIQMGNDTINGNLVTVATGSPTISGGGAIVGAITTGSTTLKADIQALNALSAKLAGEQGTALNLGGSSLILDATKGTLDSAGNYVFTITSFGNCNLTINGTGSHNVVLNYAGSAPHLVGNVSLTGGLTASQVLFNLTGTGELHGSQPLDFNATILVPNAKVNVNGMTLHGHIYGGAAGQDFQWVSGAAAYNGSSFGTTNVATVTASTSTGGTVSAFTSAHVTIGDASQCASNCYGSSDGSKNTKDGKSQDGGSQDGGSHGKSQDGESQDGGSQDGGSHGKSQDGESQGGGSQGGGSQDGGSQNYGGGHSPCIPADIQVGGNGPSGNLFAAYTGTAATLEFGYNPGSSIATLSENSIAGVTGTAPASTATAPAFIVVSNSADGHSATATNYFEGTVSAGGKFYADATTTLAGVPNGGAFGLTAHDFYAHVFSSEAAYNAGQAAAQEISYDVSGAHGIALNDNIGSLKLVGYVSTTNHGYVV